MKFQSMSLVAGTKVCSGYEWRSEVISIAIITFACIK
jgi:hypothetical protein